MLPLLTPADLATRGGIRVWVSPAADLPATWQAFSHALDGWGLRAQVHIAPGHDAQGRTVLAASLADELREAWAPGFDTLGLCERLGLDTVARVADLEREIAIALLLGPVAFDFPSVDEFISGVHVRRNIVLASRQTALDFHTTEAERPADCWVYERGRGFTIVPGAPLIDALTRATQPAPGETLYSFSCYRASEYVILLAIAQEAAQVNPELLARLQRQSETRAVMSGQFHDVFLREYGSMTEPLPPRYFVPGDRTWFRNPDDASSDVPGFEGSWVFYEGGGLYSNYWQRGQPFTLQAKCLEVYHWRDGLWFDAAGEPQMNEDIVKARVQATLQDSAEVARVMSLMTRLRDPSGVYAEGGCIDTSREHTRWVRPGTSDLVLPDVV
jgi:hypothetical protein